MHENDYEYLRRNLDLGVATHTFTLVARCPATGQLGVATATHSLAVGGYVPAVRSGIGAVASQAFANPALGQLALHLLEDGYTTGYVMKELHRQDTFIQYRQIALVDGKGNASVHTGTNTTAWTGHVLGDGFVAMGNCLESNRVTEAMANAFVASSTEDLAQRLLSGLESGRRAGGQSEPMKERSAALVVYDNKPFPYVDLRIDVHTDAITELRRIYEVYRQYIPLYYELRVNRPDKTPPQDLWIQQQRDASALERDGDAPVHRLS